MPNALQINGITLYAHDYKVSKNAKLYIYPIPNSNLDSILPMGAENRVHQISCYAYTDSMLETLMQVLTSNNVLTLTDLEGNNHSVAVQDIDSMHVAGQVGIYTVTIDLIETNG